VTSLRWQNRWKTRPIFVTSTFSDMHAERDWLRERVFPVLEERLRARRCHLEVIDLRWGVETVSLSEEQAKEFLVLKVCLEEIERSRPFLVGLLGERYGTVMPEQRVRRALDEAGFQTEVAGRSVTALEIEYGVLGRAGQRERSHFFLRDPLPYADMPPEVAARFSDTHSGQAGAAGTGGASQTCRSLKRRLERQLPSRVHPYAVRWDAGRGQVTGLERFGEMVLESLWADLEAEIPPVTETAPSGPGGGRHGGRPEEARGHVARRGAGGLPRLR
jgi:hypothetical protein